MCHIIQFPQDQNDRVQKVKEMMERKRKPATNTQQPQNPNPTPVKPPTTINTKLTLHVANVNELNKTIEATNDILKYVTDSLYDLSTTLERVRKGFELAIGVFALFMLVFLGTGIWLALTKL